MEKVIKLKSAKTPIVVVAVLVVSWISSGLVGSAAHSTSTVPNEGPRAIEQAARDEAARDQAAETIAAYTECMSNAGVEGELRTQARSSAAFAGVLETYVVSPEVGEGQFNRLRNRCDGRTRFQATMNTLRRDRPFNTTELLDLNEEYQACVHIATGDDQKMSASIHEVGDLVSENVQLISELNSADRLTESAAVQECYRDVLYGPPIVFP